MKQINLDDLINIGKANGLPRNDLVEATKKLYCTTCKKPQTFKYRYTLTAKKLLRVCDYYTCTGCLRDVAQNIVEPELYIMLTNRDLDNQKGNEDKQKQEGG